MRDRIFKRYASNEIWFLKVLKIHEIFVFKIREFVFFVLFDNIFKEKMFTNEIEDGRETP